MSAAPSSQRIFKVVVVAQTIYPKVPVAVLRTRRP
jgi:hypothetical protein